MAVGGGYEYTYERGMWSLGKKIDTLVDPQLTSVSCASNAFCVAVGTSYPYGDEFTYSGGSWSSGKVIDHETA